MRSFDEWRSKLIGERSFVRQLKLSGHRPGFPAM
jgi:hypothetical protein